MTPSDRLKKVFALIVAARRDWRVLAGTAGKGKSSPAPKKRTRGGKQ